MAIKLAGTTIINDSAVVIDPTIRGCVEQFVDLGTLSAGTTSISVTNGRIFKAKLPTSGTVTFSFTSTDEFTLILVNPASGSATVAWPAGLKWPNNVAPAITTEVNKVNIFSFWNAYGDLIIPNISNY